MTEINALPTATGVNDADFLVLHRDGREASQQTRRVTRSDLLNGVARTGAAADFAAVTATNLSAPIGAINSLNVTTGLIMGATLSRILTATASVAIGALAAYASADVTMTVTGAIAGDVVILNPQVTMPGGLRLRPWVSGPDTVTISVLNGSNALIGASSYSLKAVLLRVA